MNKKAYIKPQSRVVYLESNASILAGSNEPQSVSYGGNDSGTGTAEGKGMFGDDWD